MRSRYSRSIKDSIFFLIIVTSGLNCAESWEMVSVRRDPWASSLRCL
jgi:hypothetical protein